MIVLYVFNVFIGLLNLVIGLGGLIIFAHNLNKMEYGFWARMVTYLFITVNFMVATWLLFTYIPKVYFS